MQVEQELHSILTDLAPEVYETSEEAKIVAIAADIYNNSTKIYKLAQRDDRMRLSHLTDALLQAMGQLGDWTEPLYIDGRDLTPDQIVRKASQPSMGDMDFISDEDVLAFLDVSENDDSTAFKIDDGFHPTETFSKGNKQWSDSLKR